MDYAEFLKITESKNASASEQSLRLWHAIYSWVLLHGYADTADSPEFIKHMSDFRKTSVTTLNTHLRRMAEVGLLKRHLLKRKLPREVKEEFFNPILTMFAGVKELPTSFYRYCLPDQPCSREFKSAARMSEAIDKWAGGVRANKPL